MMAFESFCQDFDILADEADGTDMKGTLTVRISSRVC
jgi:hypothetical protein